MKKLMKTFEENLEQLEISKLRKKYEALGYDFFEHHKRKVKGKAFIFDAYANHTKKKDEIIFEVKSSESINKGDTEKILRQRDEYRQFFPKSRFMLVLAREPKEPVIANSDLNILILEFIKKKYIDTIRINGFKRLDSVDNISFERVDFKDFNTIEIEGIGNLKFWITVDEQNFIGETLTDGIPFKFNSVLQYIGSKQKAIYQLSDLTEMQFDLSEFISSF